MIGVVHLVWAPLGADPLREFVRSYRERLAGADHELMVILNGLTAPGAPGRADLLRELDGTEHRLLELDRPVLDLAAYGAAAAAFEHPRLCFLNSYAVILVDGWLGHLGAALERPDVGIAGATGNWESQSEWRRGSLLHWPQQLLALPRARRDYPRYPNPHIRTSSFLIDRDRLLGVDLAAVRDKRDAYLVESGFDSLTRRVQADGLRAVVVDREGRLYDPPRWPESHTFRSGAQENLLISDNQTRAWEAAPAGLRRNLSRASWGSG